MTYKGQADDNLWNELYPELRRIATSLFWHGDGHTLQATAVVNEMYLKLCDQDVTSREHFMNLAVRAMRQVIVDHARGKGAQKRGGDRQKVPLLDHAVIGCETPLDELELLDLLEHLASINERDALVASLRIMMRLTHQQVAEVLGVSERTARTHWKSARAHLLVELGQDTTE